MQDGETVYSVDLKDREVTDEDLADASKKIRKKLYKSLDAVTDQMVELALRGEREDVRLRASSKILDEISGDHGKNVSMPPVSVQIVNAIPLDRSPIVGKVEAATLELEGQKIAIPKEIKRIMPSPAPEPGKLNEWRGGKVPDTVGFTEDPASVPVPTLPARDTPKK